LPHSLLLLPLIPSVANIALLVLKDVKLERMASKLLITENKEKDVSVQLNLDMMLKKDALEFAP